MTRPSHATQHPAPGSPWTLLGPDCLARGDLLLTGDVVVHGRVEGSLFTDGAVHVAADGVIEGGVHARSITVAGVCRGRMDAVRLVRILAGATVHAEVSAPVVDVDERARFFGHPVAPVRDAGKPDPTPYGAAPGNA